jgi:non-ribosomal peptide synthetase component F
MASFRTITQLLEVGEATRPALRATEGRAPLTFGGLRALAERTVATLNGLGIGRGDRVAIVLPNGPEMAAVFVAVACAATTAPLNPAYRQDEFEFYIDDLKAKALLVAKGVETPARAAAAKLGVPVIEVVPGAEAGAFTLEGGTPGRAAQPGIAAEEDVALVLHTSGTTGAAEDRAADACQRHRLGAAHRRDAAAVAGRFLPQRHAALPHPRADRGGAVLARRGRRGGLHAGLRRAALLPLDGRGAARPGSPPCPPCTRRSCAAPSATARSSSA